MDKMEQQNNNTSDQTGEKKLSAEDILENKIMLYNMSVNDMSKFLLNKRELKMFSDCMQQFSDLQNAELKKEKDSWARISDCHFETNIILYKKNTELKKENEQLLRWKKEQMQVWTPVLDFMQDHKDIELGESISKKVVEFIKERDELKKMNEVLIQLSGENDKIEHNLQSRIKHLKKENYDYVKDAIEITDKYNQLKQHVDELARALDMNIYTIKNMPKLAMASNANRDVVESYELAYNTAHQALESYNKLNNK